MNQRDFAVIVILVLVSSMIPIAYFTTVVPSTTGGGGGSTGTAQCPSKYYAYNVTTTSGGVVLVCSEVSWSQIINFPSACPAGQYVYAVNSTTLICSAPSVAAVAWSQITNFPTGSGGCASGTAFVFKLNSTNYYCSQVSFHNLTNLPSGCTLGTFATGVNGTNFQCSTVAWSNLTGYPSGCASGYYVTAVGSTLNCNQVKWGQIINFPSSCISGDFVTGANSTEFFCAQVQLSQIGGTSSCPTSPQQYVITVAASIICATPVDSVKINSNATYTGALQFLNTTTIGIYNGGGNTVYWKILSVQWNTLTGFPTGCPAGQFVSAVGTILTCSTPSGSGAGTGTSQCTSGQYVYNVTDTSTGPDTLCAQVQLSQIGGTSSCPTSPQQYVITVAATVTCATPLDSLTVNANATLSGLITFMNTTTIGIYNGGTGGHTVFFKVISVPWAAISGYPSGCTGNKWVTAVGSTLTCSSISWSQIASFPSGEVSSYSSICSGSSAYVYLINATNYYCSQVSFSTLTNLPSACSSGQYATGVTSTAFTCSAVGWIQLTGFPSSCTSGYFVTGVGTTLTCTQVAWGNIINFPAACPTGQVVSAVGLTLTCVTQTNVQVNTGLGNIAGYWPFTEGTGTTAYDLSGNGNNIPFTVQSQPDLEGIGYCSITVTATSTPETCTIPTSSITEGIDSQDVLLILEDFGALPAAWTAVRTPTSSAGGFSFTSLATLTTNTFGSVAAQYTQVPTGTFSTTFTVGGTTGSTAGTYNADFFIYDLGTANPATINNVQTAIGTSAAPAVSAFTPPAGDFIVGIAAMSTSAGSAHPIVAGTGYTQSAATGSIVAGMSEYLSLSLNQVASGTTVPFVLHASEAWAEVAFAIGGYSSPTWGSQTLTDTTGGSVVDCHFQSYPCLYFNDGGYGKLTTFNNLPAGAMSWGGWINDTANSAEPAAWISQGVSGSDTIGYQLVSAGTQSAGVWECIIKNGATTTTVDYAMSIDTWNNIWCTFSPHDHLQMYLNGALVNTTSTTISTLSPNSYPFWLGNDDATDYSEGLMSQMYVYNTNISSSQVSSIYASTPYPFETQLGTCPQGSYVMAAGFCSSASTTQNLANTVGYYPLTTGTGSKVADLSGSNNNLNFNYAGTPDVEGSSGYCSITTTSTSTPETCTVSSGSWTEGLDPLDVILVVETFGASPAAWSSVTTPSASGFTFHSITAATSNSFATVYAQYTQVPNGVYSATFTVGGTTGSTAGTYNADFFIYCLGLANPATIVDATTATGSSASAAVTSFLPPSGDLVVGYVATASLPNDGAFTAGTNYTLAQTSGTVVSGESEYWSQASGVQSHTTVPFTLHSSVTWVEGAFAIGGYPSPTWGNSLGLGAASSGTTIDCKFNNYACVYINDIGALEATAFNNYPTGSMSWGGWFNDTGNTGEPSILIAQGFAGSDTIGYQLSISGTQGAGSFAYCQTLSGGVTTTVEYPVGQDIWYNAWCSFNSGVSLTMYLNGILVNSTSTTTTTLAPNSYPFWIGNNDANVYSEGLFSQVEIFNIALTPVQASSLYSQSPFPFTTEWQASLNNLQPTGGCATGTSFLYKINSTSYYCSAVSFASLTNLPTGCSAGQYANGVTSTAFTCSAVGWTQLSGFPSACSAGYYVTGVGSTLTCGQVAWSNLISFPSGEIATYSSTCGTANDFVYFLNSTNFYCKPVTASSVAWSAITSIPSGEVASYSTTCGTAGAYIYFFNSTNAYCSAVNFAHITSLPSGCTAGKFATGVNSTAFTCSGPTWAELSGFPSACSAGYFVTGVGSSLSCTQVAWGNIISLPIGQYSTTGYQSGLVQSGTSCTIASGTTGTCTISLSGVKVGDTLIVGYGSGGSGVPTYTTPSDGSNTYTTIVAKTTNGNSATQLWYSTVKTGGSLTITCAFTAGSSTTMTCNAQEYYGLSTAWVTSTGTGSTTSASVTSFSPPYGDVAIGNIGVATATTISAGTDYTALSSGSATGLGSYNATWIGVGGSQATTVPFTLSSGSSWSEAAAYSMGCGNYNTYVYKINSTNIYCSVISVPWSQITSWPSACSAGSAVTGVTTTLQCSAFVTTVSYISTTCAAGSVVNGITTGTVSCTLLPISTLASTSCEGNSFINQGSGTTISCSAVPVSTVSYLSTSTGCASPSHVQTVSIQTTALGVTCTTFSGGSKVIATTTQAMDTTTFTTINALSVTLAANTYYEVSAVFIMQSALSTGSRFGYTYPVGSTASICFMTGDAGAAQTNGCETTSSTSVGSTSVVIPEILADGYIQTGSNSGTFQFLFDSTTTSSVTVEIGSWVNACVTTVACPVA